MKKEIIGCIHLLPTIGAPMFQGNIEEIYNTAITEAKILEAHGVDALIIENFRDRPFYPGNVPPETIAMIAGVAREVRKTVQIPIGIAVLRNDAESAMAIATAVEASFIRINIHVGVAMTPQGIIQGHSHLTLRMKKALGSNVKIWSDVQVKHSTPLVKRTLVQDIKDVSGMSDAIIISGESTGQETALEDIEQARKNARVPIYVGSGVTLDNLEKYYSKADGIIVGSYFKVDGNANNMLDEMRVKLLMEKVSQMKSKG